MKPTKIIIDEDTGHSDSDERGFRSFQLIATGVSLWELLEDAHISEVDQDGGDVRQSPLDDYPDAVIKTCERIIAEAFLKQA